MEAYNLEHTDESAKYDAYEDEAGHVDYLVYDDGYIEQEPRWTRKRVIWFLIAIVIIVAMVLLLVAPFIQTVITPAPTYLPPPVTPPSQL